MEYNYSIIIPHKNDPEYLKRLLNSIPIRDDIQIIIVDDNSDSTEVDFSLIPGIDRPNTLIYYTKDGKGAGFARNVGLSYAQGKWIIFADSDDFFYDNAFIEFDRFLDSEYDVIFFNCDSRDGNTMEIVEDRMPIIRISIENKDYDSLKYKSHVPWGKMIKKSIIKDNQLTFEEIEVSNDVMFSLKLGLFTNKVGLIQSDLYCCTKNDNSLFFRKNVKRMKIRIETYKRANSYLYNNNINLHLPFPRKFISFFLPRYPHLFLWGIWECRYKGATLVYIKDIMTLAKNSISYRIMKYLHLG